MPTTRKVVLGGAIYPADALAIASQAFAELCAVRSRSVSSGLEIEIEVLTGAPAETADEFLNYLLCAALEPRLAELDE
jgi:hypothetical protein